MARQSRVFWAGDSTVKENTIYSYPQTGIGQVMKLFLKKGMIVYDYAENGRSTKSFIDEGRMDMIEAGLEEGDFLFIQFGHNDEKEHDKTRYTTPFGTYSDNLKAMIEMARKHGAYPVLITSLYRRIFDADGKTLVPDNHGDYPAAMKKVGEEMKVPVIDLCSISKAHIEEVGPEVSKEWYLFVPAGKYPHFPEGKCDTSHLQYAGAVEFAGIIAKELVKLGGVYEAIILKEEEDVEDPMLLVD